MNPVSNLEIVNNKQANRFETRVENELAVLEYHSSSNVLILNHTEVPQHLATAQGGFDAISPVSKLLSRECACRGPRAF